MRKQWQFQTRASIGLEPEPPLFPGQLWLLLMETQLWHSGSAAHVTYPGIT